MTATEFLLTEDQKFFQHSQIKEIDFEKNYLSVDTCFALSQLFSTARV